MKMIQVPDGLKRRVLEIADNEKAEAVWCESCYGACDLPPKIPEIDEIIHFGHNKLVDSEQKVRYVEMRNHVDEARLREALNDPKLDKYQKIGLLSSLQFLDSLKVVKDILERRGERKDKRKDKIDGKRNGKKCFIGKSEKLYPGQILGCNIDAAREVEKLVDCFLFVGSGKFHPLGVALYSEKPVLWLDVEKWKIEEVSRDRALRAQLAAMALARDARRFGILVSIKPGQFNIKRALDILKKIKSEGKEAYLLIMNEIKPEKIPEGLDCLINTACPRIAIEDRGAFKQSVINSDEFYKIFSK